MAQILRYQNKSILHRPRNWWCFRKRGVSDCGVSPHLAPPWLSHHRK